MPADNTKRTENRILGIIRQLLERFHAQGIVYCHWKSNEHLAAAMVGDTDLDILFDSSQRLLIEEVLIASGFKHLRAVPQAEYEGIESYFGMDPETTKIVHVHAHFRLTIGEKYLKGYHVPWESVVLGTRVFCEAHGIYIADPHVELVLLLTREALKRRTRDTLRGLVGAPWMDENSLREMTWLLNRVDREAVAEVLRRLGATDEVVNSYMSMLRLNVTGGEARRFVRTAKRFLRPFREYSAWLAPLARRYREARYLLLRTLRRINKTYPTPVPVRRARSDHGLVIAFIGTDGSGKSTAVESAARWLAKFDAVVVYLGSGNGPSSLPRRLLKYFRTVNVSRSKSLVRLTPSLRKTGNKGRSLFGLLESTINRVIWAVLLVFERRRKLKLAWLARQRGMMILTDRYPQAQVAGWNDGPLLSDFRRHKCSVLRWIANWEQKQYECISLRYPPDLVVRLRVSPVTSSARRAEMTIDRAKNKQDSLFAIAWPRSKVVAVDADMGLDAVTEQIRRLIWEII